MAERDQAAAVRIGQGWRLPALGGGAMRIYVAVWALLLAAAVALALAGLWLVRQAAEDPDPERYVGTGFTQWSAYLIADIGALLVPLTLIPAAILLFRQRQAPVPALLSIAFLIIAGTSFHAGFATDEMGLTWLGPAMLSIGWSGFILALLAFPDGRLEPRWAALIAAFLPIHWIVLQLDLLPQFIELLSWIALIALAVAAMATRYRRLPMGGERQQLRWVFFGFWVGTLLFGAAVVTLTGEPLLIASDPRWSVWIEVFAFPLAALGVASYALGLIVSLLRYRLYDADTVIGRSVAYGVLTLGFITIFASVGKIIELAGEQTLSGSLGRAAGIIGAGLAALVVVPLHDRVRGWADRRFQAGPAELRRDLPRALYDARDLDDSERLLASALAHVRGAVHATQGAALLAGPRGWHVAATAGTDGGEVAAWLEENALDPAQSGLAREGSDPLFPARLPLRAAEDDPPSGWLLLGPRPDGSFFGKQECDALDDIAVRIAHAINVIRRREARAAETRTRIDSIDRTLAALAKRIDGLAKSPDAIS